MRVDIFFGTYWSAQRGLSTNFLSRHRCTLIDLGSRRMMSLKLQNARAVIKRILFWAGLLKQAAVVGSSGSINYS